LDQEIENINIGIENSVARQKDLEYQLSNVVNEADAANIQNEASALQSEIDNLQARQKEFFSSLDPDTQSKVLNLFRDSQNKYEKITNRYKKDYANMQTYLEPIIENISSRMENPSETDIAEYATQLAQLHNTIEEDPALFISRLVDRFNITQEQIDNAYKRLDNEGEVDRHVAPMAKHINSLQEKMSEYETNRYVDELSRLYDNMLGEKIKTAA
jgi:hypothetical protein